MIFRSLSSRLVTIASASLVLAAATGCGVAPTTVDTANPPTTPTSPVALTTGNWQGSLTAAAGKKPLGVIAGSIDQSGGNTSSGQFTTAVFRIQAACYSGTPVPSQGFVKDTALTLNSFAVEHQYLTLNGTIAAGNGTISGTYSANGGCADGSSGSLALQRYAPFTGTYASATAQTPGLSITTSQSDGADGSGAFPVAATAKFTNFGCFTEGTAMLTDNPEISGATFDLLFTTNDRAGSTLHLTGTINVQATAATAYTYTVAGGACNGMTGTGTLNRL